MTLEENLAALQEQIQTVPPAEQLGFLKGWLAQNQNEKQKVALTALIALVREIPSDAAAKPMKNQIVVLLHGIRTEAVWQSLVAKELSELKNVTVYPVGYGWVDALRFWWPLSRSKPQERILRELRDIRVRHEGVPLTVIAHSFSTYLISQIFNEHPDIRISKLILCGSIIPRDFRWDKIPTVPGGMVVINEVGTKDVWPVMARVASWGYGCSGTMGFQTNRVTDRYFDYGHSDFFQKNHVTIYWRPFVENGTIVNSPWDTKRPSQPWFIQFGGNFPLIKSSLFLLMIGIIWLGFRLLNMA